MSLEKKKRLISPRGWEGVKFTPFIVEITKWKDCKKIIFVLKFIVHRFAVPEKVYCMNLNHPYKLRVKFCAKFNWDTSINARRIVAFLMNLSQKITVLNQNMFFSSIFILMSLWSRSRASTELSKKLFWT